MKISSHSDLVKDENYWVFLDEKWNPTMVYAPFKPGDLYFRFLNGMHKSCKEVKIENIETLCHDGQDSLLGLCKIFEESKSKEKTPMQQLIDKIELYEQRGGINMSSLKTVLQAYLKIEAEYLKTMCFLCGKK